MTIGIECSECGEQVTFLFDGSEKQPSERCECGALYRLKVEKMLV